MMRPKPSPRFAIMLVALITATVLFIGRTLKGMRQTVGIELEQKVTFQNRNCFEARVAKVVSGEEIWLQSGKRIVIQGADSPRGKALTAAVRELEELVLGKRVTVCICPQKPQDSHGRWRAQVFMGDTSVAEHLLERCLVNLHYSPSCDSEIADRLYSSYLKGFERGINLCDGKTIIHSNEAAKHLGSPAIVEGTIAEARTGKSPLIFQMDGCKVAVFRDDLKRLASAGLDPEAWGVGTRLKVFGIINDYGGPEIILRSNVQVLEVSR